MWEHPVWIAEKQDYSTEAAGSNPPLFALLLIKSPPEISGDPIVCEVQRLKSNKSSRGGGLTLSFAITCDRMMSVFITPVIEWS